MSNAELMGVALAIPPGLPPALHQQLLFVDKLGLVGLDDVDATQDSLSRTWPYNPEYVTRLRDAGVAVPLKRSLSATLLNDPDAGPALEAAAVATKKAQEYLEGYSGHVPQEKVEEFFEKLHLSRQQWMVSRSHVARAFAIAAQHETGIDSVSLLPIVQGRQAGAIARDEALRITIESLPVPSDNVPPLEIIKFRQDSRNRERLLALRRWASRVARGGATAVEMREELEALLLEYKNALRDLERRYEERKVAMFFTTLPSVLHQLLSGAYLQAGDSLFTFAGVKAQFFKDERSLPGREVSYIVAADQRFGGA
jgi:Family of unknown function (DUF6236)